jgi:para-aminobenzoate synthetase/4-amino-4-deoxychorismate lyase
VRGTDLTRGAPRVLRRPLAGTLSLADAARWLRLDRRPVVLAGAWAGGGALLTSEPVRQAPPDGDPFELLDAPPVSAGTDADAEPVGGGWFGWIGFEAAGRIEVLPPAPPRPSPVPDFDLAWHDHVIRLDPQGRWWFEALWTPDRAAALAGREAEWRRRLRGVPPRRRSPEVRSAPLAAVGSGASGHAEAVREAIERIAAGEIFQVNLCLRLETTVAGDLLEPWLEGIAAAAPAYGAYIGGEEHAVASLSPELFLRRRHRHVVTRPIKGTAPIATDPEELVHSLKNRAENVMIVDLMRNDLGRVCEFGSVAVEGLCEVEPAAGVWQLVSTVSGTLRPEVGDGALLRATFPPGSVTGAPKIQALKVIHRLESTRREAYCGAIGMCSPVAGLELSVAIRTLECSGRRLWLGAGGAVMHDSTPSAEVDEALLKARGVASATGLGLAAPISTPVRPVDGPLVDGPRPVAARGLIETVLVAGGRAVRAAEHLARLRAGAAALGLPWRPEIAGELAAAAARLGDAALRIELDSGGWRLVPRPLPESGPLTLRPVRLAGGLGALKWADRRLIDAHAGPGVAALICDLDGSVLEAAHAGVLIVEGERIVAPALDGRLLASISRAHALAAAGRGGLDVSLEPVSFERARAATALLLTSSLRGVHPGLLPGGPDPAACERWTERLRAMRDERAVG